ncbi:MAG: hypothetical protein Kow0068_14800 [Marinilabiliales bacterium]
MKYILLKTFLLIGICTFSQIIDQQVIPYPRTNNDTRLIIKCLWANSIYATDSCNISIDSLGYYITILGYYSETPWPAVTVSVDTFNISSYILADKSYLIKYVVCLLYPLNDTVYRVDSTTHRILVESSSKVETNNNNDLVKLYPNPSSKEINIICKNMQEIELINEKGQLIEQYYVNSDHFVINVANRNKGIYFVKVETINGNVIEKIVVN